VKAPQQLRRPENWQDFESLCKKLWGEIWNCPEIRKNGRQGQSQNGVDIYGIPSFDKEYYGIQCKGKDEYTHKQFSNSEIDIEIEKARNFKPKLKKLYFATTAIKDVNIEEYIRIKNIEHLKNGIFEVHIFSWEDIVDLIDENKKTHDWYVKSQNYKRNQSVRLTFQNNSEELTLKAIFRQTITHFEHRMIPVDPLFKMLDSYQHMFPLITPPLSLTSIFNSNRINHSYCEFYLRLHNTGIDPIEEYKIFLKFDGEFHSIDTVTKGGLLASQIHFTYDTFINQENKTGNIVPKSNIIVGDESVGFDDIVIKPCPKPCLILIDWKLISKDFKEQGQLRLNIEIEIKKVYKTILVDDQSKVGTKEGEIEDYITDSNRKDLNDV
jgi:hypothetical protein